MHKSVILGNARSLIIPVIIVLRNYDQMGGAWTCPLTDKATVDPVSLVVEP